MRDAPSPELAQLLDRLALATPAQLQSLRRFARRQARQVPLFDSIWIDALVQKRFLTPFQAREINAGRGERLGVGPLVLVNAPLRLGYADCYPARHRETGQAVRAVVSLVGDEGNANAQTDGHGQWVALMGVAEQLRQAHQAQVALHVAPVLETGLEHGRLWMSQPADADITVGEWLLRAGRLPGEVVLELARQMAAALAELELFSLVHGDLSASTVRIIPTGELRLGQIGLRSIVRPDEGYAHADLFPEAYDYLAPERIALGTRTNVATDLYACGCLWWRMLTARAPLGGGDSLAKIKSAHAARIVPLHRLAPDASRTLISTIARLTSRRPEDRGPSFAELSASLGAPTPEGQTAVARHMKATLPKRRRTSEEFFRKRIAVRVSQETHPPLPDVAPAFNPDFLITETSGSKAAITLLGWTTIGDFKSHFLGLLFPSAKKTIGLAVISMLFIAVCWGSWRTSRTTVAEDKPDSAGWAESGEPNRLAHHRSAEAKPLPLPAANTTLKSKAESEFALTTAITEVNSRPIRETTPAFSSGLGSLVGKDVVLPTGRIVSASSLELHAGMRVAPPAGQRAKVQVSPEGWRIDVDRVRLENIDFLLTPSNEHSQAESNPAFIVLAATTAQFHGCTFQVSDNEALRRLSAIRWIGADGDEHQAPLPPAGQLLLANSVLANIHTGIDCRYQGPVVLELDNLLFAAPAEAANAGPLCRLDHPPHAEDSVVLRMNACTMRASMALVDIYCSSLRTEMGSLRLDTTDCVFDSRPAGAILRMIGPFRPDQLLHTLVWRGQGSLLPNRGRFALWYDGQGSPHPLDDTGVDIDGLVRGGFDFAGPANGNPQDSQLTHWAAPLIGDSRPGVHAGALPKPPEIRQAELNANY